jgi:hypothetical protein
MKNVINSLSEYVQNQKICGVYYFHLGKVSDLKFYFCEEVNGNLIIKNHKVNDSNFFKLLYQEEKIGKNDLLKFIHKELKKEKYIHLDFSVDIIITKILN